MKRRSNGRTARTFLAIAMLAATLLQPDSTNLSTYTTSDIGVFGSIGVVALGAVAFMGLIAVYNRYQTMVPKDQHDALISDLRGTERSLQEAWDTESALRYEVEMLKDEREDYLELINDYDKTIRIVDYRFYNQNLPIGNAKRKPIPSRYAGKSASEILEAIRKESTE